MGSLASLYQDLILDHNRTPRNYRSMEDANRKAEGHNPLCGDKLTLWLRMEGDVIEDAAFQGSGCAISRASASLMTVAVKGKSRSQAEDLVERFRRRRVSASGEVRQPVLARSPGCAGSAGSDRLHRITPTPCLSCRPDERTTRNIDAV
jgi:nitrogen fixation NifU-like protein